jgi:hypothetical protein
MSFVPDERSSKKAREKNIVKFQSAVFPFFAIPCPVISFHSAFHCLQEESGSDASVQKPAFIYPLTFTTKVLTITAI